MTNVFARAAAALEPHQRGARAARIRPARALDARRALAAHGRHVSDRRQGGGIAASTPGCLEEFDDVMTGPGRPAKRLRLSRENSQVVGVTVDVRTCEVAAAGFDGVLREDTKQSFPTPQSYDELLAAIVERVKSLRSDEMPILCIGISVVGLVDYRKQEIRLAANLPFLDGKKLGQDLSQAARTPIACSFTTRMPSAWPSTSTARPAIWIASPCSICAPASAWA